MFLKLFSVRQFDVRRVIEGAGMEPKQPIERWLTLTGLTLSLSHV